MIILTGFIGTIMITQYYGIVTGEAIMGANIVRDGMLMVTASGTVVQLEVGQVARRRAGSAIAGYLSRRFQGAKVV
ncbi:MAG: hypothetical protein ACYC38_07625 [Eubacteriales bacterium]